MIGYVRVSLDSDQQSTDFQRDALLSIVNSLKDRKVAFRSLTEGMDTTSPSGEFLFYVFGALAQYECALIQERVVAGLTAACKRGRIGGWPQAITNEKLDTIIAVLDGSMSKAVVCQTSASSVPP